MSTESSNMANHDTASLLLSLLFPMHTFALPTADPTRDSLASSTKGWSTEAILAIVGVFVAMLCCVISLAWPKYCRRHRSEARTTSCKFALVLTTWTREKLTEQVHRTEPYLWAQLPGEMHSEHSRPLSRRYYRYAVYAEHVEIGP